MKKEFTIDVDKWRCGDEGPNQIGSGFTEMLNSYGEMCCLGQISKQMGVEDDLLLYTTDPSDTASIVRNSNSKVKADYLTHNPLLNGKKHSKLATEAIIINDDPHLTLEQRKEKLTELFKKKGIKLRWKNIKKYLSK